MAPMGPATPTSAPGHRDLEFLLLRRLGALAGHSMADKAATRAAPDAVTRARDWNLHSACVSVEGL